MKPNNKIKLNFLEFRFSVRFRRKQIQIEMSSYQITAGWEGNHLLTVERVSKDCHLLKHITIAY